MGNGHPLGAVITSRAIADSFEREGYFFSSAGGSPVSCAVGSTVLDIMADEKLQDNARDVGDYLKEGQTVRVKVLEADDKGRLRLSMKAAAAEAQAATAQ